MKNILSICIVLSLLFSFNPSISMAAEKKGEESSTVNLVAVGDNLIHSMVIESGLKKDGTYNYDFLYSHIKNELKWADVKVINQETVLVNNPKSYSGYPAFGSPTAVGKAVEKAGFNVVLQATNHSYDKGLTGIEDTLNFWKKYKDITVLGMHGTKEDYNTVDIIEINNIKIAMLNYTYSLNGLALPKDKKYLVSLLNDKDKIKKDLKYAEKNADITIVFPHWGTEYVFDETKDQKDMAQFFVDNGADVIIGAHPHVVEPLKVLKSKSGKKVPVYYSLGNFVSNMDQNDRMLGAMAKLTITKDSKGTYVSMYEMEPLVTHIEKYSKSFTTYMLKDYTEKLAAEHRMRRVHGKSFSLKYLKNLYNSIID